jgi:hypothetical protein
MKKTLFALFLIWLSACGNTPFDEGYWEFNLRDVQLEQNKQGSYKVTLLALSNSKFSNGQVTFTQNGDYVSLRIDIQGVSQYINLNIIKITETPCSSYLNSNPSLGDLTKDISYTESKARFSILTPFISSDNVAGKSFVVWAVNKDLNSNSSTSSAAFPFACGETIRVSTGS